MTWDVIVAGDISLGFPVDEIVVDFGADEAHRFVLAQHSAGHDDRQFVRVISWKRWRFNHLEFGKPHRHMQQKIKHLTASSTLQVLGT